MSQQIDLSKQKTAPVITDRSLGQLVADATKDVREIVQHEIALAKAELKKEVVHAGVGIGMFVGAAIFGLLGLQLLFFTGAFGLVAAGLAYWLSFLIVTVIALVIAGILALIGKSRLGKVGPPEKTITTTKGSVAAVKGQH